ncbi:MAG: hypothetical protein WC520_00045 [Candidatus Paceibacterota bacterium]
MIIKSIEVINTKIISLVQATPDELSVLKKDFPGSRIVGRERDRLFVPLKVVNEDVWKSQKIEFPIPYPILEFPFSVQINTEEMGGCDENGGKYARIICELRHGLILKNGKVLSLGDRLRPFSIPKEPIPLGIHAYFSATIGVSVICGNAGEIFIKQFWVNPVGCGKVQLDCQMVWRGEPENTPIHLKSYDRAIAALVQKSECSDCTHMHYTIKPTKTDQTL